MVLELQGCKKSGTPEQVPQLRSAAATLNQFYLRR
jgi:hypothetical protein